MSDDWRQLDGTTEREQYDWCKKHLAFYSLRCPFCEPIHDENVFSGD